MFKVREIAAALQSDVAAIVSIFACRIAYIGVDPLPIMRERDEPAFDMVAIAHDILKKAALVPGQDLTTFSLETVRMFARDALQASVRILGRVITLDSHARRDALGTNARSGPQVEDWHPLQKTVALPTAIALSDFARQFDAHRVRRSPTVTP